METSDGELQWPSFEAAIALWSSLVRGPGRRRGEAGTGRGGYGLMG